MVQESTKTENRTSFPVEGMTCASCVRSVEKSLGKVPGVSDIRVNLIDESVNVALDEGVTEEQLRKAVEKAGYKAGQIRLTAPTAAPSPAPVAPGGGATQGPGTVSFDVGGMTCASCVRRVEKALGKVEGLSDVNVNLATEKATVSYAQDVTADEIRQAVEKAGYTPGQISLTPPAPAAPVAPATGNGGTTTFDVAGMTCASCVRRVEKALEKVDGVSDVSVNLATEKATVTYGPDVNADQLRDAVAKAGYTPGEIALAAQVVRPDAVRTRRAGRPDRCRARGGGARPQAGRPHR